MVRQLCFFGCSGNCYQIFLRSVMTQQLINYIKENNPDLLLQLEKENGVDAYLADKINSIDISAGEEICMDLLTEDLRPSKYHYILSVLDEEFGSGYESEAVKLVYICDPLLEEYNFKNN